MAHHRAKIALVVARVRRSDVWQLFGALWAADRSLAFWWWALILLRSMLPAAFVVRARRPGSATSIARAMRQPCSPRSAEPARPT